jgi:hypothetical protein
MHDVKSFSEIRANHQETITAMDFLPISQGCCAVAVTYGAPRDLFRSVREEEGKLSSGTQASVIARDQSRSFLWVGLQKWVVPG